MEKDMLQVDGESREDGFFRRLGLALFDAGYSDPEDIENVKRCQLTNIFSFILSLYMFIFAVIVLAAGDTYLAIFDLAMGSVALVNYCLLRKLRNSRVATNVVVVVMSLVVLSMAASGGRSGTGMIWIVLYPLVVLPLKGPKRGAFYSFIFFLAVLLVFLFGEKIGLYKYSASSREMVIIYWRMIFVYLAVTLVAYTFVRNRHGLYREIKKLSLTDPLTLLPNRRSINVMVNYHVSLFRRRIFGKGEQEREIFNIPFSCILCDLDDFKNVNDTYGHDSGDLVLKEFSNLLKESLRGADFIGRWGGEEFLIILGGTDLGQARTVGRKLVAATERHDFCLTDGSVLHLTMSCGIASFSEDINETIFFRQLDENLYLAKGSGKNCAAAEGELI